MNQQTMQTLIDERDELKSVLCDILPHVGQMKYTAAGSIYITNLINKARALLGEKGEK